MRILCTTLLISTFLSLANVLAQTKKTSYQLFERSYVVGETSYYELTSDYYQNGKWKSQTIARCELVVIHDRKGLPWEEVRWISKQVITEKDTLDETPLAVRVNPYRFSFHLRGSVLLPEITEPSMTGAITDFHTFLVAIHEHAGMGRLKVSGDAYQASSPVKGDFSNSQTIIKGEDCILLSSRLVERNDSIAIVETSFLPPAQPCLTYYHRDMNSPVVQDTLNNIQMVMPTTPGKFNLQYGREQFRIISTIDCQHGKLTRATMVNDLQLILQINCNEALESCQARLPWHIYRTLTLTLLPQK